MQSELLKVARPTDKKIEFLVDKYKVSQDDVELAIAADPTENLYVEWLIRMMRSSRLQLPAQTQDIRTALDKFNQTKNSPAFREQHSPDINRWIPEELLQLFIEQNLHEEQKSETKKEKDVLNEGGPGAAIIFKNGPWKVFDVTTPDMAVFLGSNSHWCTTQKSTARDYLKSGHLYIIMKDNKPWGQYHKNENGQWDDGEETFMDVNDRTFEDSLSKDLRAFLAVCPLDIFDNFRKEESNIESHQVGLALSEGYTFDEVKESVKNDQIALFWTSVLTKTPIKIRMGAAKKKFYEVWMGNEPIPETSWAWAKKEFGEWRCWDYNGRGWGLRVLDNEFLSRMTPEMVTSTTLDLPNDNTPVIDNFNKPKMIKAIQLQVKNAIKNSENSVEYFNDYWAKYQWFSDFLTPMLTKQLIKTMKATDENGDNDGHIQDVLSQIGNFKIKLEPKVTDTVMAWIKENTEGDFGGVASTFISALDTRYPPMEEFVLSGDDDVRGLLFEYAEKFKLKVKLHD